MSLVTGLLTHQCTVLRPQFDNDDNITSYQTINQNVAVTIVQKNTVLTTETGGRQVIVTLIAVMEWTDETQLTVNDVLTNVKNISSGVVIRDSLNGGALVNASFKVTGNADPNYVGDHLEVPVEHFHGRLEGQP